MSQLKLIEFNPNTDFSGGDKILYFADAPGGISHSIEHLNPVNSRRTQDGTLITQTLKYNKKVINLTIGFFDVNLKTYFQLLYESGYRTTFTIYVENPVTYATDIEFTGEVQILTFVDDTDVSTNVRTITMTLAEA